MPLAPATVTLIDWPGPSAVHPGLHWPLPERVSRMRVGAAGLYWLAAAVARAVMTEEGPSPAAPRRNDAAAARRREANLVRLAPLVMLPPGGLRPPPYWNWAPAGSDPMGRGGSSQSRAFPQPHAFPQQRATTGLRSRHRREALIPKVLVKRKGGGDASLTHDLKADPIHQRDSRRAGQEQSSDSGAVGHLLHPVHLSDGQNVLQERSRLRHTSPALDQSCRLHRDVVVGQEVSRRHRALKVSAGLGMVLVVAAEKCVEG